MKAAMAENQVIYDRKTLEFVAVALECCAFLETASQHAPRTFADRAVKILPLLYLRATLLPEAVDEAEAEDAEEAGEAERFVTEAAYEDVRCRIAALLGEHDAFLDTFHPDMQYSDAPVAAAISECLADVYQDLGDFTASFRRENEAVMRQALSICRENFRIYWGQQLLNALKALHGVRFGEDLRTENHDY